MGSCCSMRERICVSNSPLWGEAVSRATRSVIRSDQESSFVLTENMEGVFSFLLWLRLSSLAASGCLLRRRSAPLGALPVLDGGLLLGGAVGHLEWGELDVAARDGAKDERMVAGDGITGVNEALPAMVAELGR
jgi:hypothetical protein